MRITLVQPPSNYQETFLLSPPLGLLSIAAAAENEGADVTLLDFNLKGLQDPNWQTAEYFYPNAVELIEQQTPDIVGFTSMAIESHVCLETAKKLKERNPNLITVFGGPHFGAIATEALTHYDWVDYVISGEGEAPLQNLVRYLKGSKEVISMDNIAYRDGESIQFNRKSMAGRDLDEIPFPAYHLVDMEEYFELNPSKLVCFEHARGCYLKCSFCYSPQHWGHGESAKSNDRILRELKILKDLGINELFWVGDNLLNSKHGVIKLCDAIYESGLAFKWHCYGTLPQLTPPVLDAMSRSGCRSIFVGVDAVSDENKKSYQKTYFKSWEKLRGQLLDCINREIRPTCAFMLSPTDSDDSVELTLREAAKCALLGCFVRINALTHYNGTQARDDAYAGTYSSAYAQVLFDTAELLIENDFARTNPTLFPFHQAFAENEVHERFARYCRLSMQTINGHQLVSVSATAEHNIAIKELVDFITDNFTTEEVSCRNICTPDTRRKYLYLLYKNLLGSGFPDDLADCDFFLQSETFENLNYELNEIWVENRSIPVLAREFRRFETKLNLDDFEFHCRGEKNAYLASLTEKGGMYIYGTTPPASSHANLADESEREHALSLSVSQYMNLTDHGILRPTTH